MSLQAGAPLPHPSLAEMDLLDVLRLIRSERVGPHTFFQLVKRYGTAGKALAALPDISRRGGSGKALLPYAKDKAEAEIEAVERFGARLIAYGSDDYPALLQHIADPPPLLTVLGNPTLWKTSRSIGMVGARNASANGCAFARRMGKELGQAGLTVTSGLARGIDTHAHRGALESGTVAVIAGGIDNIYPPENAGLYAEIKECGAIISEQPFGSLPFAGSFPGRNRIISGMSEAVVVVEASVKSGSLITARFAAEQGREVCAVPGFPLDPRSSGCNKLLKQGATLVESAEDVVQALSSPSSQLQLLEGDTFDYMHAPAAEIDEQSIEEAKEIVLEMLGPSPVSFDELLTEPRLTSGLLFTVLMELELGGRIQRHSGNKISLSYAQADAY